MNKVKYQLRFYSLKLVVVVFLTLISYNVSSQVYFSNNDEIGNSGTGYVTLAVEVNCDGYEIYSFTSSRRLKNVFVNYNYSGFTELNITEDVYYGGIQHSGSDYTKDVTYAWTKYHSTQNLDAMIELSYEFEHSGISDNWTADFTSVNYDHTGLQPPFIVDFLATEVSPHTNLYNFTYTGSDPAILSNVFSYDYDFYLDYEDVNSLVDVSGASLTPNSLIGGSSINPHFYCHADGTGSYGAYVHPRLKITPTYKVEGQLNNNTTFGFLHCPVYKTEEITLTDLCTEFTGFSVDNVGPTEFHSEVTTSSSGNSILDGMVGNNISVERNNSSILSSLGAGVTDDYEFPNSTPTPSSNDYQNYSLTETIVLEQQPDYCGCENTTNYNTNNPCFNLSDITATSSFLDGEYVYTFTLSDYLGGSSNTYAITSVTVDFGDGASQTFDPYVAGTVIEHVYPDDGSYTMTQTVTFNGGQSDEYVCEQTLSFGASTYCCINFAPTPEDRYWLSAWVKEDHATQQKTYENTYVEFSFDNGGSVQLHPSGDIIEGWQRIVGEFTIPSAATNMQIDLVNESTSIEAYFDDVRVHPFNASMKSYVYDPETLWLTAELDDNNYATFYEYDKEGQLIRIKKETARGIMTIQESRSSNPKSE